MLDEATILAGGGLDLALLRGPAPERGRDDSLPQPVERNGSTLTLRLHGPMTNRSGHILERLRMAWSAETVAGHVAAGLKDKRIETIVLDIDSSGGVLAGAVELADVIREGREKKTILAKINATAGGPGYVVASAAGQVLCVKSGQVGGIGVMAIHLDHSQRLAKAGVRFTTVRSTPAKARPLSHEQMSADARADLQTQVSAMHRLMVQAIAANRGISAVRVNAQFGRGRMMSAARALEAGMIDALLSEAG